MSDLRNIDFGFVGAEGALSPTLNKGKPIFKAFALLEELKKSFFFWRASRAGLHCLKLNFRL